MFFDSCMTEKVYTCIVVRYNFSSSCTVYASPLSLYQDCRCNWPTLPAAKKAQTSPTIHSHMATGAAVPHPISMESQGIVAPSLPTYSVENPKTSPSPIPEYRKAQPTSLKLSPTHLHTCPSTSLKAPPPYTYDYRCSCPPPHNQSVRKARSLFPMPIQ